jgi:signal peptidase I
MSTDAPAAKPKESVKETIISVVIAFALAFVFRAFVAEAYVIPTGSMAPTLNGAHMRFNSPTTGANWAVGPWHFVGGDAQSPFPSQAQAMRQWASNNRVQSAAAGTVTVHDPLTGEQVVDPVGRARAGDRVFVHKYLYALAEPEPWDVVVFKDPTNPDQNFIKRMIGLPGEEIALVDGDVFFRKLPRPADPRPSWSQTGWQVRRKPARIQNDLWQPLFDSSFMLPSASPARSPLVASGELRAVDGARGYDFDGRGEGVISWDVSREFIGRNPYFENGSRDYDRTRAITDRGWYNEVFHGTGARYPVGDLRLSARITLGEGVDQTKLKLSPTVTCRAHEFRAHISNGQVQLQMRAQPAPGAAQALPWTDLLPQARALPLMSPGSTHRIEFWHVDQSLQVRVDDELLAYAGYDWGPQARLEHVVGRDAAEAAAKSDAPVLQQSSLYKPVGLRWEVGGGAVQLRALAIHRDLFYTPASYMSGPRQGEPALATSPTQPLTLEPNQFFVCGDNSPNSSDARLWPMVDPWVAAEIDPTLGVVDRRLLLGKAFFVYFPAPMGERVPVPDFGRMRFIQ